MKIQCVICAKNPVDGVLMGFKGVDLSTRIIDTDGTVKMFGSCPWCGQGYVKTPQPNIDLDDSKTS